MCDGSVDQPRSWHTHAILTAAEFVILGATLLTRAVAQKSHQAEVRFRLFNMTTSRHGKRTTEYIFNPPATQSDIHLQSNDVNSINIGSS
jgi:hypothetical protein